MNIFAILGLIAAALVLIYLDRILEKWRARKEARAEAPEPHGTAWGGSIPTPVDDIDSYHDDVIARELADSGRESWLQTSRSRSYSLLHPKVEEVDLFDVAQTVSRLPRFLGRTIDPYFVAQHLVLTALLLWKRTGVKAVALHGAAHDLHEAYLGDIPTPLAWALGGGVDRRIRVLKQKHDVVIFAALGLEPTTTPNSHAAVKAADADMLIWERDEFLGPPPRPWFLDGKTKQLTHEDFGLAEDSPLLNPLPAPHALLALCYLLDKLTGSPGLVEHLYTEYPPCSIPTCASCQLRHRVTSDIAVALAPSA